MHWIKKNLSLADKLRCYTQLSALTAAAIPLTRIFNLLLINHSTSSLTSIYHSIHHELQNGSKLSECIPKHPQLFDTLAVAFITFSESTGQLDQGFAALCEYTNARKSRQEALFQALTYPLILFISTSALLFFMLYAVVPHFALLYQNKQITLPLCTQLLFFIAHHLFIITFLFFILSVITIFYLQSHCIFILQKIPGIKNLFQAHQQLHLLFALKHGLAANLTIDHCLQLSNPFLQSTPWKNLIHRLRNALYAGSTLHEAFQTETLMPTWITALIQIGEESGSLESLLSTACQQLDNQIKQQLNLLTACIQPLILLLQGALIGGVVLSLYLPLFNLGTLY